MLVLFERRSYRHLLLPAQYDWKRAWVDDINAFVRPAYENTTPPEEPFPIQNVTGYLYVLSTERVP